MDNVTAQGTTRKESAADAKENQCVPWQLFVEMKDALAHKDAVQAQINAHNALGEQLQKSFVKAEAVYEYITERVRTAMGFRVDDVFSVDMDTGAVALRSRVAQADAAEGKA